MGENRNIIRWCAAILLTAATLFVLPSCDGFHSENVAVNVEVNDVPTILVLNGEIELDSSAWVELGYTEDIDAPADTKKRNENSASVALSTDDGQSENLAFQEEGRYVGNAILGEVGKIYTLTVQIGTKTYSAVSKMLSPPGYDTAWVIYQKGGKGGTGYSDEWKVLDPPDTRNRYLFEWWTNGTHVVRRDWAIDDNRVVNAGGSLRLFTVTMDPGPNEHIRHRAAEIDKITYDYYNMYEKIVRGIVGVGSQTPYNPVSNFGEGTIGNFRAVAFSEYVVLTPPAPSASADTGRVVLSFPSNAFFVKYNLYWANEAGVSQKSNALMNLSLTAAKGDSDLSFAHDSLSASKTYYYRLQVEDEHENKSVLSPEIGVVPN